MAAERIHQAPCPACGAPVTFLSAQSTHAVCSFCRSTVARDGDTLSRVGKVAELFDDHSPLQRLATGRWQGKPFTVVGRIQYRGPTGPWTEWNVLFDTGGSAWLAEDNGAYVMAQAFDPRRELPQPAQLRLGATTSFDGRSYQVTSNEEVAVVSAEGELPKRPQADRTFAMVELRGAGNEVLSLDYGSAPPAAWRGVPVTLPELQMQGLREESVKQGQGRQLACPNCGAPITLKFDASKTVSCPACRSVIDLTQGVAGELRHAEQDEPVQPPIPVGSIGQLQGVQWQVVGYQNRLGTEPDDPDEHFGWEEYLLFNRQRGFCFLVDDTDGWSLVKPTTGAPTVSRDLQFAEYLGTKYRQQSAYKAQTSFVEGEFYWPVRRGQVTFNRDYAQGDSLLSLEEDQRERTWSIGRKIDSDAVAKAFGLQGKAGQLRRGDSGPITPRGGGTGSGCGTIVLIILVILILLVVLKACDDDDNTGRSGSGSGSRGGWSSGGAHK